MSDIPASQLCPLHGWYANDSHECQWCVLDVVDAEYEYLVNDMTFPGHCALCSDSRVRLADCDSGNFTVHCAQCGQCTHCYGKLSECYRLPPVLTEAEKEAERHGLIATYCNSAAALKKIINNPAASQQNRDKAARLLETVRRNLREIGADAAED